MGDELVEEVDELLSMGSWRCLFYIREQAICMLTLEVLPSFEFDRSYNNFMSIDAIRFRAFGQYHSMSVMQFSA